MGFDELQQLSMYWRRIPPAHVSVAAFLGTGKPGPAGQASADQSGSTAAALAAALGSPAGQWHSPIPIRPAAAAQHTESAS